MISSSVSAASPLLPRLPLILCPLQALPFPLTGPSPPHLLTEDQWPHAAGPSTLAHLVLAVKVRAADIKATDVRWNDAAEQENKREESVAVGACEEDDAEGREEEID